MALPYMAIKEASLASGQSAYDYLKTERTELLPFVAFNTIAGDLLQRLSRGEARTALEKQLAEDLEALLFVRMPQYPSSRAFGSDPVLSLREYQQRAPASRARWKIVPVAPRVFPAAFKDPAAPRERLPASSRATWIWSGVALAALALTWLVARRRQAASRRSPPSAHR